MFNKQIKEWMQEFMNDATEEINKERTFWKKFFDEMNKVMTGEKKVTPFWDRVIKAINEQVKDVKATTKDVSDSIAENYQKFIEKAIFGMEVPPESLINGETQKDGKEEVPELLGKWFDKDPSFWKEIQEPKYDKDGNKKGKDGWFNGLSSYLETYFKEENISGQFGDLWKHFEKEFDKLKPDSKDVKVGGLGKWINDIVKSNTDYVKTVEDYVKKGIEFTTNAVENGKKKEAEDAKAAKDLFAKIMAAYGKGKEKVITELKKNGFTKDLIESLEFASKEIQRDPKAFFETLMNDIAKQFEANVEMVGSTIKKGAKHVEETVKRGGNMKGALSKAGGKKVAESDAIKNAAKIAQKAAEKMFSKIN